MVSSTQMICPTPDLSGTETGDSAGHADESSDGCAFDLKFHQFDGNKQVREKFSFYHVEYSSKARQDAVSFKH